MRIKLPSETESKNWFQSGFGRLVAAYEYRYCHRIGRDAFGFYGVQMGRRERNLVRYSPVRNCAIVGHDEKSHIVADWEALPFADDSLDYIVALHALEIVDNPHSLLRETVRVLRPEGRLLIVGFNPWSLLGFFAPARRAPWRRRWLSLARIKDWLALLDMTVVGGVCAVFSPPFSEKKTRRRFHWMEKAGRRWWPLAGGVYFLQATKRRAGMTVIVPKFRKRFAVRPLSPLDDRPR